MTAHAAIPAATTGVRSKGRVGPNAVTRLAEALASEAGTPECGAVFADASASARLADPPTEMVDEDDVARLHRSLRGRLGPLRADRVARDAGRRTGDYLLAHRIPHGAQRLLRHMPKRLAAAILVRAIGRHAWTFAGSGRFAFAREAGTLRLEIRNSPLCRLIVAEEPACGYYAATFERVFSAMLGPTVRVEETACSACGAPACRFAVRW